MKKSPSPPTAPTALRRQAESRLRAGAGRNGHGAGRSAADSERLLHELQVHQIELEMQNEELRLARDEMEQGLEKYSELYDFAPVGYLSLGRDGAISEANLTAASLLGIPRAPLVKQRFALFVALPDRPLFHSFLQQVFERKTRRECDVRLLVKGKPPVDVRLKANLFASGLACRMAVIDITADKLAESVTAQLAAIVTSSSDAIIGRDLGGNITSWNAGAERIFGYGAGEMVGGPISRLVPAEHLEEEAAMLHQIRLGKNETRCETVRVAKDGRRLEMSITNSPIRQKDGRITGISKVARDITEQKQATNRVFVSEVRYRRLFEAAQDGILILDPNTRKITEANPFIVEVLGYSREQLIGKELWQIGLLKDEAASQEAFRELRKRRFIRYEDLPLETRGGKRREMEFVSNLYDEDGESVIQCNIRDITDRKLAEESLRASEERFRALFDLGPVGVYSCDARGLLQNFNRCAAELWGREPQLGSRRERFGGSLQLCRPDGTPLPHRQCPMAAVLAGKVPAVRDQEVVIERPDRSRITVIVNIVPLKDGRGQIMGAINCFYDITARKHNEEVLAKTRRLLDDYSTQLEGKIARRTAQLTATNRQLAAALQSTRKEEEQNRVLLQESQVMQNKLRQLTHQILTAQEEERKKISRELHDEVVQTLVGLNVELSTLVHGNAPGVRQLKDKIARTQRLVEKSVDAVHRFARDLRPAVLDDLGLIPALHAFCKELAARKKLKIHLTAFAGVEKLPGDQRTVLYRVALEALANVARHARATLARLTISKIPGAVRMEIGDNGKSFPVGKFLLAKNNKRLGLVGMKERVEMVGGNLTIESVSGKGTTVLAEIPFVPPPHAK